MLSGYQCEIIAYIGDGEIICRDCAAKDYSELTLDKLDAGISCVASGHISPLIRYSVDELDRSYEYAEERWDEFQRDHPALYEALDVPDWRVIDRRAEKHPCPECCGSCGKPLD